MGYINNYDKSYPRYVWRDVAKRYVRMYGGEIEYEPLIGDLQTTDHLLNKHGETIGVVWSKDYYTKKYENDNDIPIGDIPY